MMSRLTDAEYTRGTVTHCVCTPLGFPPYTSEKAPSDSVRKVSLLNTS